ncbi:MAG: L-rhamnonate dehydratase [Proteobacteria bacterium]|nr:L-rhamnonate dehydratase [Pseudomonadota bacterium]
MKIKSVRAFAIKSDLSAGPGPTPPRRPAWTADAEVAGPMSRYPRYKRLREKWRPRWPAVGCIVEATDGSWGFGISRYGAPVIAIINEHLGPLLVDEPCMAIEKLWDMMYRMVSPYGGAGLASYAISAIDIALWDLKGKLLKTPVYALLGGPARDRQFCYATGNDTDWHMELGFRATKLACPHGTADGLDGIKKNEDLVALTRELIGKDVELMLDCWMAFDVEFAVRLAERLRPYGLKWLEDCLMPEDMDGFAELRRRLPWQTIATGEHWYTTIPFASAAARRLADIFQPDIAWVGGVTACVKICHLAEAAGIAVMPHAGMNTPDGQHLCYAMPNIPWGEYFLGTPPGVPLAETALFPGTAYPKDGYLVPNDAPGFGIELTLDQLERMKISPSPSR